MTFEKRTNKKDDELLMWTMVGGIFTVFLLFIDFGYSSVNEMAKIAKIGIWIGHGVLGGWWVITFAHWKDPNYDKYRVANCLLAVALCLIIGIHHATSREDKQVIIDSHQNAAKP